MIAFSNQTLLVFSLYDLCCIILTIGKQIIAFTKGHFAPPAPPTERQEGRLLPSAPLSGVPGSSSRDPEKNSGVRKNLLQISYKNRVETRNKK